ncbi:uncharacterized protein LOC144864106 isoform X2 [Branchiostoma floridae x Branchiostoma japonicum]
MARVLALVVVIGLVGAISAQSYKGCYKRKWGTFRTRDTSDDMTNEKCVEICAKEGLPYAGTYETKCGCGRESELTRLGDPTDESECASTCGGDVTQKCGQGNGLLTVWATGKEKREMKEAEDVKEDTREAQSYKGCYKRKWGTFRTRDSSDDMTNEKCVEICAKEGLPYSGTYGTKCGCGRESELTRLGDPTDESECASTCGGDVTQKCGKGNGLLTVWATGKEKREMNEAEDVKEDTRELEAQSYKGCYKRKWGTFRTRDSSDDMTNEKCVEICAKEGLPYAGTYETKCGCGRESELTRLGDPTDESECASTCGGDVTQKCGKGNGLLTVWATGKEKREMNEVEDVKQDMRELEHHHHHHHDKKTADESHDKKAADEGHDKVATD